jgi:hypothetical protein
VVVASLTRRSESYSTRNGPALAPSRHHLKFGNIDHLIAGEVTVRGLPLETRQLIREIAHANFLWGAPRIHGELLKLGIRAPLPRHKCRRTFIRNLTITIVQSRSFSGHNWAGDLLSQFHSHSRVFTYHLSGSARVVASVAGRSCWAVWYAVHPLLIAMVRHVFRLLELQLRLPNPRRWWSVRASRPVRRTHAPFARAARPSPVRYRANPTTGQSRRPPHRDTASGRQP